jgi:hypothetical protein
MKPILFSTPMVQAILDGRKTQTRRVMNPQPTHFDVKKIVDWNDVIYPMPKYKVGDILWVRENWQSVNGISANGEQIKYAYKADGGGWGEYEITKWKPSIFMPKEAARIFLRVMGIRAERLQDISEEDAVAEGILEIEPEFLPNGWKDYMVNTEIPFISPKMSFASLWKSINGEQSWEDNPYVWVIPFERVENPHFI